MRYFSSYDEEQQPLTTWGGHPVYAAHVIVAAIVATMILTTLALAFRLGGALDALRFASPLVLGGQVWRMVGYGLVNAPSISLVIDIAFLAMFGREVEKALGRTSFLRLYGCLYLIPPLLLTAVGLIFPTYRAGNTGALAVFVAFATYYPGAGMMFNLTAKWAAFILVGIFTLMAVAYHDWTDLICVWSTCGFAHAYVRHARGELSLPSLPSLRSRGDVPSARRASSRGGERQATRAETRPPGVAPATDVDALLDKIAREGIHSLTPAERARLDQAQARLAKRRGDPSR